MNATELFVIVKDTLIELFPETEEKLLSGDEIKKLHLNRDLGIDSVEAMELVMELESALEIRLTDEEVEGWQTIEDVCTTCMLHFT